MSRRKRWNPPHPDTTKIPEPKPRDINGNLGIEKCSWHDCPKSAAHNLTVALCMAHALITFDAFNDYLADTIKASQTQRDERVAALQANAEMIDAGERVTSGPIPGWIYYIKVDDTIKIGYARNVTNRMRAYPPSATLLAVEPGTKKTERDRHSHFNAYLAHGREWFRDVPELREWIDTLIAEYGDPSHMAYRYTTPQSGKQVTRPRGWRGDKRTAA